MDANKLITENLATITRVCAGFHKFETVELVQMVCEHIAEKAAKHFDPSEGSAKNFVANVAKNKCIAFIKLHKNSRRGASVDTVGVASKEGEPVGHVTVDYDTPFTSLVRESDARRLFVAAAALDANEWRLFVEIHRTDRLGEIAVKLGVSNATITRARKALIAKLAQL